MSDFLRHFFTALGLESGDAAAQPTRPSAPVEPLHKTHRSTTVFSGTASAWSHYLGQDWQARADGAFDMGIRVDAGAREVVFTPHNERSRPWAAALTGSFRDMRERLMKSPSVLGVLDKMLFENRSNLSSEIRLESCTALPAEATREMKMNDNLTADTCRIMVRTSLLESYDPAGETRKPMERLGENWETFRHILLQLGHENYPRDRFTERIELTTRWALINLHVLYNGRKDGRPDPGAAGEAFEKLRARREGVDRRALIERDGFFRLLADLSFLLRERGVESLWDTAAVIVRDYLDAGYLRLSIAGLMPAKPAWLEAMPVEWRGPKKLKTPPPQAGRYGIIDAEDEDAWRKIAGPLADIGYLVIGQLGMGQFGRVYEAVNVGNATVPVRVAVKVDRIRKGHKKEAIEAADTIMEISRGLANSPHVIRAFDAGYLRKARSNYHILQIVEGDTLDHLIGVAGSEHTSILRPKSGRSSPAEANREFLKSLSGSAGEAWRRNRQSPPFISPPGLSQILDLLTSKALWIEEVHALDFAVNDLKNGNVMMSRRGQFKAIDLDSYSRVFTPVDKLPDFFFLAVSTLQLIARGCAWERSAQSSEIRELLASPGAIEKRLGEIWPYGDLLALSGGRISSGEVTGFFARFIDCARSGGFANAPEAFSDAIDELIHLKRRLTTEELILQ